MQTDNLVTTPLGKFDTYNYTNSVGAIIDRKALMKQSVKLGSLKKPEIIIDELTNILVRTHLSTTSISDLPGNIIIWKQLLSDLLNLKYKRIDSRGCAIDEYDGLCAALRSKDTLHARVFLINTFIPNTWAYYSGNKYYPVPAMQEYEHNLARLAYDATTNKYNAKTPYGKLRLLLLDTLIYTVNCILYHIEADTNPDMLPLTISHQFPNLKVNVVKEAIK